MPLSGSNLAFFTKNISFSGFNQKVKVDVRGNIQTNYVILDTDNTAGQLYQTYMVDMASGKLRFAGRSINFPGGSQPPSDSNCWFDKTAICTGGQCFLDRGYSCLYLFIYLFIGAPAPTLSLCHFCTIKITISPSGVEITYIVVVLAVIVALALGGVALSFYVR